MFIVEFYQDMSPLRGIANNKAEFCMLLFYNITSKKDLIATDAEIKGHDPQAKFSSYIRNKQCRPINSLAYRICEYRSPTDFEEFLKDKANYPHIKQELLSNFKNRYKDRKITEENLFEQIAAIFDKLIEDAAEEYENNREKHNKDKSEQSAITKTNSEPNEVSNVEETTANNMANINGNTQIVDSDIAKSTSAVINDNSIEQKTKEHIEAETNTSVERQVAVTNTTEPNDVDPNENNHSVAEKSKEHIDNELAKIPCSSLLQIDDYILELLMLIDNLLQTGEALAKEVNRNPMSKPYKSCSNWELLHDAYKQYTEKNVKLHTLFNRYKCEVFEQVSQYKKSFTIDSFWRCNPMLRTRSWDTRDKIEEYKQKLSEISTAINNCKE